MKFKPSSPLGCIYLILGLASGIVIFLSYACVLRKDNPVVELAEEILEREIGIKIPAADDCGCGK